MHTSRLQIVLFWTLMFACIHGLLVTGWRTVDYYVLFRMPAYSLWFGAKCLCYVGFLSIGILLFQLLRKYRRDGYFDAGSIGRVRATGWVLLAVSVFNTAFNVLRDEVIHAKTVPSASALGFRFAHDYFFESPVVLFMSLFVFLFANFMERAIAIKRDNESII